MARKKLIAGNWKMFTLSAGAAQLAKAVADELTADENLLVAVCPPFPWIASVAAVVKGTPLLVGAQDVYPAKEGAFTGEVAPEMLLDAGASYVIIGHSERRHVIKESDSLINEKVKFSLASGLKVIYCIGETLAQRQANETNAVLEQQLSSGLAGVDAAGMANVVIAYEPVWAIGTGVNATTEQAQNAHAFVRSQLAKTYGENVAQAVLIQYGGSVKPDNAKDLLSQPDVDGALVGGASLKADSFLAIVRAAMG
ncbi:triose-phosphate isomerase [Tuwongella immobilis]|uniref:Triosephosphate isomerase n=1 Tax=Tuwongella immobilis TaxID=692036 RepID=A0A6C2YTG9_9BACT|nr:triose-phosphate isomerase [Tuwongella immobilis]VIP04182.1 triosephosphate isomerase : Triosephosphate isomerase OS=Rhodopirellula sallentina SM41 GN=tpiA PE=3 SV=1: TIM [Tuwongella immobilis]VTS05728.1 triosephosphate isomerase : Triosephosphate isomerase OS=Rhodopirellula sallentina SM41 GN=tpiA PE=3 SV=1: TIM [Tuwongella immobilis]